MAEVAMSPEDELDFLRFFFDAAGSAFGPADSDIYFMIAEDWMKKTGKALPSKYSYDYGDEDQDEG